MLAYAVSVALCAAPLAAQAFVPAQGGGSLSITWQYFDFTGHYTSTGDVLDLGGSQSQSLLLEADYGVTPRLALSLGLPYVRARNGHDPSPVLGHSGIDDGHYHGGLQDYRLMARFNVLTDPVTITPFVQLTIPSHDYSTEGEAAVGRGLREVRAGVNVGRRLDPWLPRVLLHLRYGHSFVEELENIDTDRDSIDGEAGYIINDRWSARLFGGWQETHGGLNFPDDVLHDSDLFFAHDRILDDDHLRAGAGVGLALSDSLTIDGAYVRTLRGSNTHVGSGVALSLTWGFGPR
jgi:hypothetical protein